jgi:hypothetical protein
VFRGRDNEIAATLAYCEAGRLVVLTAPPGLGVSAFLNEGVAPALRARGFIVVGFREWVGRFIGTDLKEVIAEAVRSQADDTFFAETETLAEILSRIRARTGHRVVLLLDHFEDYLRCHVGTHLSDSFDAELAHAIADHESGFVVALQEYAVPAFQRLEQYVPNLLGSRVKLGPLETAAGRELVTGAGEEQGIRFEPAVIEALVTAPTASFEGGIHPFFLMAGVQRLLDAAIEKKWTAVGVGMIQVYGGADRLILESLDEKLSSLSATQTDLFFRWFRLLLSDKDQRLAVTPEGLKDYSGKLNRFALTLLPLLLELGILRTVEQREMVRYEIARDSYAPMIRDWWNRREAMLIARRRARFRVRSVSLAVGSIVVLYMIWLIMGMKR